MCFSKIVAFDTSRYVFYWVESNPTVRACAAARTLTVCFAFLANYPELFVRDIIACGTAPSFNDFFPMVSDPIMLKCPPS